MTPIERRYDKLHRLGCIACRLMGWLNDQIDVHHCVDKSYRAHAGGYKSTVGLCLWHHRGTIDPGKTVADMKRIYGPSLERHGREFRAFFGAHSTLIDKTNQIIESGDEALFLGLLKRRETA